MTSTPQRCGIDSVEIVRVERLLAENTDQDLARFAHVVQNDAQVLMIEARDSRRREFGTITIAFAKVAGAPAGLMLQGWNTRDAQNNLTTVRLSNQRFNVPVADAAFRYREPTRRRGPRG